MSEDLKLVKELRDKTGAGFLDCKQALSESNNNMDNAIVLVTIGCIPIIQKIVTVLYPNIKATIIHLIEFSIPLFRNNISIIPKIVIKTTNRLISINNIYFF